MTKKTMGDFPKDKYGIRFTLPDSMSAEEKLESIDNIMSIMQTFEKVTGEEGTTDFSELLKAKAKLEKELSRAPKPKQDKE